jgi:hypothetical protein
MMLAMKVEDGQDVKIRITDGWIRNSNSDMGCSRQFLGLNHVSGNRDFMRTQHSFIPIRYQHIL